MKTPHKHRDMIIAWANGEVIECKHSDKTWGPVPSPPSWNIELKYRIKPDPYAELKAAHAAGKRIAWQPILCNWEFLSKPSWCNSVNRYKIIEDDATYTTNYYVLGKIRKDVKTKFTQCALTGKISAEVVE